MITALDTTVLLDIFIDDPAFGQTSKQALRECMQQGHLVACEVVWAELAGCFPDATTMQAAMEQLAVAFVPMGAEAALMAGQNWREYRQRGFYRSYFQTLSIRDAGKTP